MQQILKVTLLVVVAGLMGGGAAVSDPDEAAWQKLRASYLAGSRAEHNHRIQNWTAVESWTFDDGVMPAAFRVIEGQWRVEAGVLEAHDGEVEGNRILAISRCRWPAFRLSFDVMLRPRPGAPADRIGDIGIRIGADPQTASFAKGYAVILAQYANQAAVIYRLNVPFARTEMTPIEPGRLHHVMVEYVTPHIRVWVDGRVVLEAWERAGRNNRDHSDFLTFAPDTLLALHTWDTHMAVDNLTISVPE